MAPAKRWIVVRNWETFQHYRDRTPSWIKLYPELLTDPGFSELPESTRLLLVELWMLYASSRGRVPADTRYLSHKLSIRVRQPQLNLLIERGWIVLATKSPSGELRFRGWPSRHIPVHRRAEALARDDRRCVECGSTEDLEIDHIIPVSRWNDEDRGGGDPNGLDNLQTLCRRHNRSKHSRTRRSNRVATAEPSRASREENPSGSPKSARGATPSGGSSRRTKETPKAPPVIPDGERL